MSTKLTSHLPAPRSKSKIFSTAVILDLTTPVNAAKMTSALIERALPNFTTVLLCLVNKATNKACLGTIRIDHSFLINFVYWRWFVWETSLVPDTANIIFEYCILLKKSRLSQTANVGFKMSIWHKTKRAVKKKLITWLLMAKKRHWVMWEFGHVLSMCRVYMILNVSIITNATRILCNFMWNTNGSTEKQRTN